MDRIHDNGIIVRSTRFSETSLILTWFTRDSGIISTMAKGALRPKQKLFGKADLFYRADLHYLRSPKSQLHRLLEIDLLDQNTHVRKSYLNLLASTYYYELAATLMEKNTPVPEIYLLFEKALAYLALKTVTIQILHHYERRLYQIMGYDDGKQPLEKIRQNLDLRPPASSGDLFRELA